RSFWCYKFRSMHINEKSDELQATKGDKRVTALGAFLRKTSIDEFPQFFNVIKGEMSIVGPRPHMLKHTELYGVQIDNYLSRLTLKQGLTGWAQVKGYRGETSEIKFMEDRVRHDLWYMYNWSFWLDIKIVFLTAIKIFKAENPVY
ncbi:MAG: sugar transferase, partial [Panacibacter sp.]